MSRLIDADELADMKFSRGCTCVGIVCVPLAEVKENIRRAKTVDIDKDVRAEAYNEGLEDAWELARKVGTLNGDELSKIFGITEPMLVEESPYSFVMKMNPQKALTLLEAYEKEQAEIKVGDVVEIESTKEKYVIIAIYGKTIWGYNCEGVESPLQELDGVAIKKTGKHIDIQSALKRIAE